MKAIHPSEKRWGDPQRSTHPEKQVVYPIFLPHFGCPFRCVYCNQNCVTAHPGKGTGRSDPLGSFHAQLLALVSSSWNRTSVGEVALYGGTFTALPRAIQVEMLEALAAYVDRGIFKGIRFSTRPDGISPSVCDFLRNYPVRTIELGIQSFSDQVLRSSGRGYDAETAIVAASIVKDAGWALGIQLMIGLPGDSQTHFRHSVLQAIAIAPAMARLYPTLVLRDTKLASWLKEGSYSVMSLEETLDWCSWAYEAFAGAGIPVARMGLHADPELMQPGNIVAGPFHPAFGYLVRVRCWRVRIDEAIRSTQPHGGGRSVVVRVPERSLSEVLGPGRENLAFWKEKWQLATIRAQGERDWPLHGFECVWE